MGWTIQTNGTTPNIIAVSKIDSAGNDLWAKYYSQTGEYGLSSMSMTTDGGYIIVGYCENYMNYDAHLLRLNSNGDSLWARTYGSPTTKEWGRSVIQSEDGGFLLVGTYYDRDAYIVKTSSTGNKTWSRIIGDSVAIEFTCSVESSTDGGYMLAGYIQADGASDKNCYFLKVNAAGYKQWSKSLGGIEDDELWNIAKTYDGAYIASGRTKSFGAGGYDMYLVALDRCGDSLWTRTFGTSYNEFSTGVRQTSGGGFILCGETTTDSDNLNDTYVVKVEPLSTYPSFKCGDANGDCAVNMLDATYIINYLYYQGPAPDPIEAADANGNGAVNVLDATYILSYLYNGGPAPVCP